MSDLSFQEKSTLISLLSTLAVGTWYGLALRGLPGAGLDLPKTVLGLTVAAVALMIVVEVVLHIVIAIASRDYTDAEDERDRLVKQRAASVGGLFMTFGVVTTIGQILILSAFAPGGLHPLIAAYTLMATLVLAELIRFSLQFFFYRRGV